MAQVAYIYSRFMAITPASNTKIRLDVQVFVGDGTATPKEFSMTFDYDAALSVAVNAAALKTAVIAACAGYGFLSVATVNAFISLQQL